MNQQNLDLAAKIVKKSYVDLGGNSISSFQAQITTLLSQRSLPEEGWSDLSIENFLANLAMMDTNNFPNKVGVGERESRIYSPIVMKRNFNMGHGIGRSGDVSAVQPKAAGSSLLLKLAKYLTIDAIKTMGFQFVNELLLLPVATGMACSLLFMALRKERPAAKYVIWPRIDQKTCLKCILTAGLIPVVVENALEGEELRTDVGEVEKQVNVLGAENVLCVFSTASCFAPRAIDRIEELSELCQKYNVFHVINNAYGLQSSKIAFIINQATKKYRVDAVVQSMDKNFLVPVGGSIIFSSRKEVVKMLAELYPGRASAAPITDLFITLLSMGKKELLRLLDERKENYNLLRIKIEEISNRFGCRLLSTKNNNISLALCLKRLVGTSDAEPINFLGSILYSKRIMGARINSEEKEKDVCGYKFKNYGSHSNGTDFLPYLNVAAAIGMKKQEIDIIYLKLTESFEEFLKTNKNPLFAELKAASQHLKQEKKKKESKNSEISSTDKSVEMKPKDESTEATPDTTE